MEKFDNNGYFKENTFIQRNMIRLWRFFFYFLQVPLCSVIRFNIEYTLHIVSQPIPEVIIIGRA